MIYLKLFLSFLKVGAFSFGGGLGMISVIRDECLSNGWLTEGELLNFIAVAESTPGPIAINIATFIGSSQGGFFGAWLATLGVVLPSFVIILIIASVLTGFLKYRAVSATLGGMRPAIIGLIFGMSSILILNLIFGITTVGTFNFDLFGAIILGLVFAFAFVWRLVFKKSISPIILIIFSGVLGVIFYGV